MTPNGKKHTRDASNAAIDYVKQIITLSSGILVIGATFISSIPKPAFYVVIILALSWLSLGICIFAGLRTMAIIVKSRIDDKDYWAEGTGRKMASWSRYSFLGGLGFFAIFAFIAYAFPASTTTEKNRSSKYYNNVLIQEKSESENPTKIDSIVGDTSMAPK